MRLHQVLLGAARLLLVLTRLALASFLLLAGQEENTLPRRGQNVLMLVRRGGGVPWLLVRVMLVVRVVLLVRVGALHLDGVRLAHYVVLGENLFPKSDAVTLVKGISLVILSIF